MVKLTGHSQLDANAMATSILSGGWAIVVAYILFQDSFEHQQQTGLVHLHWQLYWMNPVSSIKSLLHILQITALRNIRIDINIMYDVTTNQSQRKFIFIFCMYYRIFTILLLRVFKSWRKTIIKYSKTNK
jgi:uncharacterized membrane protein YjgN (DUF898 family)